MVQVRSRCLVLSFLQREESSSAPFQCKTSVNLDPASLYRFPTFSHLFELLHCIPTLVAAGVNAEPIVDYLGGVIYNTKWYNMMVNHVS